MAIDKITMTKTLCGNESLETTLVETYLCLAEDKIKSKLYPLGTPNDFVMPSKYELIQCELASRMIARRGAEGEIVHNVDGVNRTYDSVDDQDILDRVVPFAKVVI